jgi:hypothetical protein
MFENTHRSAEIQKCGLSFNIAQENQQNVHTKLSLTH